MILGYYLLLELAILIAIGTQQPWLGAAAVACVLADVIERTRRFVDKRRGA